MIVHFRSGVTPPVLEFLKSAADQQRRSLANLTGKILSDYVATQQSVVCQFPDTQEVE